MEKTHSCFLILSFSFIFKYENQIKDQRRESKSENSHWLMMKVHSPTILWLFVLFPENFIEYICITLCSVPLTSTQHHVLSLLKMNNNNKKSLKPLSMIFGGQLLVNTGPLLECGWYTYVTTLKKIDFPSFSSYHLKIASWLGVGHYTHFPSFV